MKKTSAALSGQNKKQFVIFRLILLLPILLVAVFYWEKTLAINNTDPTGDYYQDLIITEIMYNPNGNNSTHSQWIEIYNTSDKDIFLLKETFGINNDAELKLSKDGASYLNCHGINEAITIPAKKYIIITNNITNFNNDYIYHNSIDTHKVSIALPVKESSVRLSDDKCKHFFLEVPYKNTWGGNDNGKTLEKNAIDKNYAASDWHESCAEGGTPGQENSEEKDCKLNDDTPPPDDTGSDTDKKSDYADRVKINEIYPAPLTAAGEKEFVEIENSSGIDIDFSKWCLKDKTENDKGDSGSCKKIDDLKKTGDFSVFYGTFSLNNDSKGDTVFLYDNNKVLVDSRVYTSPKSSYAYAFDGAAWRWTSFDTPGQENIFDKILSGKILKDDKIYKNIYADFEVKADDDAQKFTWDFGDGHKSYLQKTKHKYEKTGDYDASLKITGKGEDALYAFSVTVENYAAPRIRITRISPNPKGSDTGNEWIEIQNNSKKKLNLKGWSIATGWDNLVNHPIREDFKIGAGKIKKLLHDICAFTLTNAKDKIELRDPSGKVVQKIEYDNGKKSIQEEAIYQKEGIGGWAWSAPIAAVGADLVSAQNPKTAQNTQTTKTTAPAAIPIVPEIPAADLGKYSIDPTWQKKQNYQIELANFNSAIKIPANTNNAQPRVLGARTISSQETFYTFTGNIPQNHWLTTFAETFWLKINSGMNRVLNVI